MPKQETNMVSNKKQSNIFTETFNKLFKENKESSMFDRFSSLDAKEKILAVSTVGVILGALLPVVAVALPVASAGAAVALTLFFAVKAVEYAFKGLKWSAEKTWEGAKHVGGKIRDDAAYVKDQLKSGTSHTVHNVSQSLDRLSSQTNYSEAMLNSQLISSDAKNKIVSIKEQFINIFDNEKIANKDRLLEKILEKIVLQIESKKDLAQGIDSMKYAVEWSKQINFINGLDAEKLHDLLTKQSSPKNTYFLYTIFSEHHDKIEMTIRKSEKEHTLSNSMKNLNKVARKHGRKVSSTQSTYPSLSGGNSISSLNSNSTDGSTAGLVNPEEYKEAPTFKNKMSSWFRRDKVPKEAREDTKVKYTVLPGLDGEVPPATVNPNHLRGNSSSSSLYDGPPVLKEVAPPKVSESPTSDYVSERSSPLSFGLSTPENPRFILFPNNLNKSRLKEIGHMDKLVPSTKVDVDTDVQPQTTPKSVA